MVCVYSVMEECVLLVTLSKKETFFINNSFSDGATTDDISLGGLRAPISPFVGPTSMQSAAPVPFIMGQVTISGIISKRRRKRQIVVNINSICSSIFTGSSLSR